MRDQLFSEVKIRGYKNMPELVAQSLKDAIIRGEFKGGVQLKQDEIAKQFEVSLIPVREALIQLEGMGLARSIRNKGTIVTTLSTEEMKDLFELRRVMEWGAVMLIQDDLPQDIVDKMTLLIEKMQTTDNFHTFSKYNRLFYLLLCSIANNKELDTMYEKLFVRMERYLNCMFYYVPEMQFNTLHHQQIVELLKAKNKEALVQFLTSAIDTTEAQFIQYLRAQYTDIDNLNWNVLLEMDKKEK